MRTRLHFTPKNIRLLVSILLLSFLVTSCASTGPKVSKEERKRKEEEFNAKFLQASEKWVPRIYRVGYRLISAPVPGLGREKPTFGFVGVGVDELEDYARKAYGIDKKVKGVLVRGIYPGSEAEGVDIRPGDVIQKLNGKKTRSLGSFFKRVRRARDSILKAEIWRRADRAPRQPRGARRPGGHPPPDQLAVPDDHQPLAGAGRTKRPAAAQPIRQAATRRSTTVRPTVPEGPSAQPALDQSGNRRGEVLEREIPVEKVYYNAQFFLAPTPDLHASSTFSKIDVGIGAIRYCRNDDELAVVMGHELAHTTLKHSLKSMGIGVASSVFYGALASLIDAFTWGGVGGTALGPIQKAQEAAISRRYEREADYHGMLHAFHSGYQVENGSKVFSRLATDTPGFSLLAYTFSSHPKSSERFLRLEKIVEELKVNYPERAAQPKSPDWELVIPVEGGETLEEALSRLIAEKGTGETTTSEIGTATPASPDKVPTSEYPAPRTS